MKMHGRRMSIPGPVHDLEDMKARVSRGNFHPFRTSAIDPVLEVFGCGRDNMAKVFIREIFALLTDQHYAGSLQMSNGTRADEYGTMYKELGWYVKFSFDGDVPEVDLISCHLTRYPLRTRQELIGVYDSGDD